MKPNRADEVADREAEERSENEGMPEHLAKGRDPARWAADRRRRVSQRMPERSPGRTGTLGLALLSCAMLVAFSSARRAFRWVRHRGGVAKLLR